MVFYHGNSIRDIRDRGLLCQGIFWLDKIVFYLFYYIIIVWFKPSVVNVSKRSI